MTARTSSSASARSNASSISRIIRMVKALSLWGRSSVIVMTGPSTATSTTGGRGAPSDTQVPGGRDERADGTDGGAHHEHQDDRESELSRRPLDGVEQRGRRLAGERPSPDALE